MIFTNLAVKNLLDNNEDKLIAYVQDHVLVNDYDGLSLYLDIAIEDIKLCPEYHEIEILGHKVKLDKALAWLGLEAKDIDIYSSDRGYYDSYYISYNRKENFKISGANANECIDIFDKESSNILNRLMHVKGTNDITIEANNYVGYDIYLNDIDISDSKLGIKLNNHLEYYSQEINHAINKYITKIIKANEDYYYSKDNAKEYIDMLDYDDLADLYTRAYKEGIKK